MSKSFISLNPVLTVCVQNIDSNVKQEDVENFISDFGRVKKFLHKKSKFDETGYVLVEFEDEETAKNSIFEINGKDLGSLKVTAKKFRTKGSENEINEIFYDSIRTKAKEILVFAKNRIKELYPSEEIPTKKFSLPESPQITRDIPAHQLIEFLTRRVSEQSPSLLNKFRRSCKKLQLDQLYLLYNQESFFQSFLSSLS